LLSAYWAMQDDCDVNIATRNGQLLAWVKELRCLWIYNYSQLF